MDGFGVATIAIIKIKVYMYFLISLPSDRLLFLIWDSRVIFELVLKGRMLYAYNIILYYVQCAYQEIAITNT